MAERVQVNLRLPQETVVQLKLEADRQKRSVNNLMEVIIDEYLKKQSADDK